MKILFTLALSSMLFNSTVNAQEIEGTEIGFDGYFGASTNGGSFTLGAKYGFKLKEYFLVGPSVGFRWFLLVFSVFHVGTCVGFRWLLR